MVFDNSISRRGFLAIAFTASFASIAAAKKSAHTSARHHAEPKPEAKPQPKIPPARDEKFRETASKVSNACQLWRQTMQSSGVSVPPYIDARLGVMYSILETSLTVKRQGLIQLGHAAYKEVGDDLVDYLNRANVRAHIDALKNTDTKVTEGNLMRYFGDPIAQFAAMNFTALRDAQDIEGNGSLKHLPNDLKRACLYIGYNHPQVFDAIVANPNTNRSIASLAPQLRGFLDKNKRIYGHGGSNSPIKVLYQIPKVAQPDLDNYAPEYHPVSAPKPAPKRPAQHHTPHAKVKKHAR